MAKPTLQLQVLLFLIRQTAEQYGSKAIIQIVTQQDYLPYVPKWTQKLYIHILQAILNRCIVIIPYPGPYPYPKPYAPIGNALGRVSLCKQHRARLILIRHSMDVEVYVYLQITCPFLYRVNTVVPLHCSLITSECVALGHHNCISTVPIISYFHYISFSWGKCISGVLTMYITTSDSTDKTESRRRSILVDSDLLICHRDNSEVPHHL